jgi:hypothetical protein
MSAEAIVEYVVGDGGVCACGAIHMALANGSPCPIGDDGRNLLDRADDYHEWMARGGRWAHEAPVVTFTPVTSRMANPSCVEPNIYPRDLGPTCPDCTVPLVSRDMTRQ